MNKHNTSPIQKSTAFSLPVIPSAVLTMIVAFSCSFSADRNSPVELLPGWSQETVEFQLPSYPAETHPPLEGWRLLHWRGDGIQSQRLSASETTVLLTVEKNLPTAILFYPLTKLQGRSTSFFHPAGCVYPYSTQATWQEGFTAEIFFKLAGQKSAEELSQSPLSKFNWPRLTQQVARLSQRAKERDKAFSPWLLKEKELATAILHGTASIKNIKQTQVMQTSLSADPQQKLMAGQEMKLYYRYIPLGNTSQTLSFPQDTNYAAHQENAFLWKENVTAAITRKNRKPVLVIIGIDGYTVEDEMF